MTFIVPSYRSGFAPRDFEPRYPSLWRGVVGAWCPSLGPTGGVLRDWSGLQNHGTLTNMSVGTAWDSQRSLTFDGTDDYVDVSNSTATNFGTGDFTASGWFYTTTLGGALNGFFAENNPGGGNSQWWFRQETSSGDVRFLTESATGATGVQSSTGVLVVNIWTHWLICRRSTSLEIHKNGILLTSATGTVRDVSSSANVVIGKQTNSYFTGKIDDVRIYNRALSPQEIALLASRRGIAYDLDRSKLSYTVQSGFLASWSRRPSFIQGGGLR